MNRITETFTTLGKKGRKALMPYLTMGYPHLDSALDLVPVLQHAGADLIELGVPFSDPLADGATIQAASQQALENGMNLDLCLEQAMNLREYGVTLPFILMGYYNPLLQYGVQHFADRASAMGIDGVIVPDLPPEEALPLLDALRDCGVYSIFLLAPTSNEERIRKVAALSEGFIYLVSLLGVTGARRSLPVDLAHFVARVRQITNKPLAVGFGISTARQAHQVSQLADGVIVGSALIKAIGHSDDPSSSARSFIRALREGIDGN
ncbi:MAG: tryptophan synthase subunit alpha [Anaerolineae bacterium]|nr:tryptophan synthase subunit alpha [Anaerolineae bacterium]